MLAQARQSISRSHNTTDWRYSVVQASLPFLLDKGSMNRNGVSRSPGGSRYPEWTRHKCVLTALCFFAWFAPNISALLDWGEISLSLDQLLFAELDDALSSLSLQNFYFITCGLAEAKFIFILFAQSVSLAMQEGDVIDQDPNADSGGTEFALDLQSSCCSFVSTLL